VLLLAGLLWASGGGEVLLLTALPAEIASNPAANWIIALLVTGFGIKAGLPLLHMWLPLAHPAAPPAASAVLSGAMIKAGLVGWLRVLPLGFDTAGLWGWALLVGGVAASFGAALVGVTQRNPKAVLAYSSVSQMGLITSLLGCGLLQPGLWPALQVVIVLFAVHHGLAKGALFLGAGIAHHRRDLPPWLLWAGLVLPGLALAGAPLTSGAG
jgi:formate hydrogenlyase subunit 3/multisubunit Na+/H+ antiporter MnhD subunit